MNSMMFRYRGVTVTGTKEQIEKYNNDNKEYDFVKDSIERLSEHMERHEPKEPHTFIHQIRLKNQIHLIMAGKRYEDGSITKSVIPWRTGYGAMHSVPIDELVLFKDEEMKDLFMDKILYDASGLFSKEQQKLIMAMHQKYEEQGMADVPELDESLVKTDTEKDCNSFEL